MHFTNLLLSEYEQISQLTAQQYLTPLLLQQIPTPIGSIMDSPKNYISTTRYSAKATEIRFASLFGWREQI